MNRRPCAVVFGIALMVSLGGVANDFCGRFEGSMGPEIVKANEMFVLTPARVGGRDLLFRQVEFLNEPDRPAPFFVIGWNLIPYKDTVIRLGETRSEAMENLVRVAGLETRQSDQGGFIVGEADTLEHLGIVVFSYPINQDAITRLPCPREMFDRALFDLAGSRYWRDGYMRNYLGLGFVPLDPEGQSWLVVMTLKMDDGLSRLGKIVKARFDLAEKGFVCDWSFSAPAFPIMEFQEDVNSDGVRDFLFDGASQQTIVDGATGAVITEFVTDHVGVGRTPAGEVLVTSKFGLESVPNQRAAVLYRFGEENEKMLPTKVEPIDEELAKKLKGYRGRLDVASELLVAGVPIENIRVFTLPKMRPKRYLKDVELIQCQPSPLWWLMIHDNRDPWAKLFSDPEISILMTYTPEPFQREHAEIWGYTPRFGEVPPGATD